VSTGDGVRPRGKSPAGNRKTEGAEGRPSGMDDVETAVEEFLDGADAVYGEYDQGYVDADAALAQLRDEIDALEDELEG